MPPTTERDAPSLLEQAIGEMSVWTAVPNWTACAWSPGGTCPTPSSAAFSARRTTTISCSVLGQSR